MGHSLGCFLTFLTVCLAISSTFMQLGDVFVLVFPSLSVMEPGDWKNTSVWSFCVRELSKRESQKCVCQGESIKWRQSGALLLGWSENLVPLGPLWDRIDVRAWFLLLRKKITRWEFHWINLQDLSHFTWWQQIMLPRSANAKTMLWRKYEIELSYVILFLNGRLVSSHFLTIWYGRLTSREISCPRISYRSEISCTLCLSCILCSYWLSRGVAAL